MLHSSHFLHDCGPDEHVILAFLAFVASRLMTVSREQHAAYVMQALWRSRHTRLAGDRWSSTA